MSSTTSTEQIQITRETPVESDRQTTVDAEDVNEIKVRSLQDVKNNDSRRWNRVITTKIKSTE